MRLSHRVVLISLLAGIVFVSGFVLKKRSQSQAQTPPSKARLTLQPCHLAPGDLDAKCGTYEVFEDRAAKTGRKISLNIVVVPALNPNPAPDPVFWLHGGPGAAATATAPAVRGGFLAGVHQDHDVVFVDQRGTGKSNGLMCDMGDDPSNLQKYFSDLFLLDDVRQCREKLEKIANLKLYTTPIAMDDLDEVRDALGYDKIDIVAASYGTIAAQVYMRQHPDHVRAVFLGGVANTAIKQPLPFAQAAQHALDLLFVDCAADEPCHNAFPDLKKEFETVLARFDKGPVTAELINPKTREKESVKITRGNFVEHLRLFLYTTNFGRFLPLVIHRAYENDYLPFESISVAYNPGGIVSRGMYMTVTCSESIPFITEKDIVSQTKGTFLGDYRVRTHIEGCKEWPKADIPKSYIQPVKSDLPVLLISGEVDGSTPPWLGEEVVESLKNGRQVKIRYYGHQLDGPCLFGILNEFIEKGSAKSVDTSCTDKIKRPPFATEIPKQFSLQ
ncbi:MAG TPA: alpha/beta hydrolase [Blastocatellia bacterium]|nr:alpha/beta hydrolase [Blastocatellia bacterium]